MLTAADIKAKGLRILISRRGLSQKNVYQLEDILAEQFSPDNYFEIGGHVSIAEDKDLEFTIAHSPIEKKLLDALNKFEEGDYREIGLLYNMAKKATEAQKEMCADVTSLQGLSLITELLREGCEGNYTRVERVTENIVHLYREFIFKNFYPYPWDSIPNIKKLWGKFHVHADRSTPSIIDIRNNELLGINELVLSADENYRNEGIDIYLINRGDVELLYSGELMVTIKQ